MGTELSGRASGKARLFQAVKWVWLLATIAVAAVLVDRYWQAIASQVASISWPQLVIAVASLIAGKVLLGISAHIAAQAQEWRPGVVSMLAMVSMSQLGKYIPGGIWHFLGRAALYAERGLGSTVIARALIQENIWQWTGAFVVGVLLLLPFQLGFSRAGHELVPTWLLAAVALGALWWLLVRWSYNRFARSASITAGPVVWILVVQVAAWGCFGVSLFALLPEPQGWAVLALATGAFAIATLAGFAVPLAPAGLGVREAVLVTVLMHEMTAEQASISAGMSRLVWVVVEMALALVLYRKACSAFGADTGGSKK